MPPDLECREDAGVDADWDQDFEDVLGPDLYADVGMGADVSFLCNGESPCEIDSAYADASVGADVSTVSKCESTGEIDSV